MSANSFITLTPETAPDIVFRQKLGEGELSYQQCEACDSSVFPPRVICPVCGSPKLLWKISTGRGTVYSSTTLHKRGEDPYNVSLVDVDEGFRMMSRVCNVPPDDVAIGTRVMLEIGREGTDPIPNFVTEAN